MSPKARGFPHARTGSVRYETLSADIRPTSVLLCIRMPACRHMPLGVAKGPGGCACTLLEHANCILFKCCGNSGSWHGRRGGCGIRSTRNIPPAGRDPEFLERPQVTQPPRVLARHRELGLHYTPFALAVCARPRRRKHFHLLRGCVTRYEDCFSSYHAFRRAKTGRSQPPRDAAR